jgi:hypothetical protein
MIIHNDISPRGLFRRIKNKQITLAGNKKLKIYGTLNCASGKRMKKEIAFSFLVKKKQRRVVIVHAVIA